MIRFTLQCDEGHRFDSWFADTAAFEKLRAAGHLTCEVCGSSKVDKTLMAPSVRPARGLAEVASKAEAALTAMRKHVEENTTDVGRSFAKEARAMHYGEKPEAAIRGEATPAEAKSLIDDGIPVAPLPFVPKRKVN
ncbi:MAG: DUF1178 family protein [Shimia sp.]